MSQTTMKLFGAVLLNLCLFALISCQNSQPSTKPARRAEIKGSVIRVLTVKGTTDFEGHIHSPGPLSAGGFTVVPSDSLFVLTNEKVVEYQIDGLMTNDPRSLLIADQTLVFTTGSVAIAKYRPSEVDHLFQWLTANRQVFAVDLPTGRLLWGGSEIEGGTPIAVIGKQVVCLTAISPRGMLAQNERVAKFVLTSEDIRTRENARTYEFEVSTASARYKELANITLGIDPIDAVVIKWGVSKPILTVKGISIIGNNAMD